MYGLIYIDENKQMDKYCGMEWLWYRRFDKGFIEPSWVSSVRNEDEMSNIYGNHLKYFTKVILLFPR